MRLVLDASVVVKWVLPDPSREEDVDEAVALLRAIAKGRVEVVQPPHWLAEVAAVATRLLPDAAPEAVRLLHAMELPVRDDPDVYVEGVRLAALLRHHVFDTLYHAVARLEADATLVTADGRYLRAARRLGKIRALAGFDPPG